MNIIRKIMPGICRKKLIMGTIIAIGLCILNGSVCFARMGGAEFKGYRDMTWPVPGYNNLSSCFFDDDAKTRGERSDYHYALDIATGGKEVNVVAAYGGTVVETVQNGNGDGGFGNQVVIRHSYNTKDGVTRTLYTHYSHLSSIGVSVNQQVSAGQYVGKTGGTGNGGKPYVIHLDFQILTSSNWRLYKTYSKDPFANEMLTLPSNLYKGGDTACCDVYINEVKNLYSSSVPAGEIEYYPACSSSQTSLTDALKSIGVDSSFSNREKIAALNGISNYSGTADQNMQLLNLLKQGKLIKSRNTKKDTSKPTIEDVYVKDITDSGYTIHCIVRDDQGLSRVQFPTWNSIEDSSGNNQDDITWHESAVSGTSWELNYRVNYADHRNEKDCWYWTDIYCYDVAGNLETYKTVSQYVTSKCWLNIKGILDGKTESGLGNYGTCDVYVDGKLIADDCNDFSDANGTWPKGTKYEIKDIKSALCKKYEGTSSGTLSGTLADNTTVTLKFSTAHDYEKQNLEATCVSSAGVKYTCKNCGDTYTEYAAADWSEWSETYPEGIDEKLIESRIEYSYSDKQTTTSENSSLSGWTRTGSEDRYGAWSGWSDWQTDAITTNDPSTKEVETGKVYRYYYFLCPVCGQHEPLTGACDKPCTGYITASQARVKWSTISYRDSNSTKCTNSGNYYKRWTTSLGDGQKWIFSGSNLGDTAIGTLDDGVGAVVITTGYHSRTRSKTTVYKYEKWGDWSNWSESETSVSSNRRVKTRTVYRYNKTPYGDHNYAEESISGNMITYKCINCGKEKETELMALKDDAGVLTVKLAVTDKITEKGIVYGKGSEVTLETPGRTRVTYTQLDSDNNYSFDTTNLEGCTVRAYVVYTDKNGDSQVIYSDPIER